MVEMVATSADILCPVGEAAQRAGTEPLTRNPSTKGSAIGSGRIPNSFNAVQNESNHKIGTTDYLISIVCYGKLIKEIIEYSKAKKA
jgi:hypothetical protein